MKKIKLHRLLALAVLLLFNFQFLYATVYRVNGFAGFVRGSGNSLCAHCFTSLQTAVDSANSLVRDTIYLEPYNGSYGNVIISKPIVIIGNGYLLGFQSSQNDSLQKNTNESKVVSITLNAGSDGTIIEGLHLTGGTNAIFFNNTGNIIIRRNMFDDGGIMFDSGTISNVLIEQNFFNGINNASFRTHYITSETLNVITISNNYIKCGIAFWDGADVYTAITISNNVLDFQTNQLYHFTGTDFFNNILVKGLIDSTLLGNNVHHNIAAENNALPLGNNNTNNVLMSNVFISSGSADNKWHLSCPNVACGTGTGNVDMGMYGGSIGSEYRLSGIPRIPAIYILQTPSSSILQGDTIQVNISTRSNN